MDIARRPAVNGPLQVLVADDDILPQRVIALLLQRLGHAGVVVNDGAQALTCLAQRSFDVVLLDVMMPTLDGIATLAAIRRSEAEHPHTPRQRVIMVTGHAEPSDTTRLLKAGADGHITKPINASQFEAELWRVMHMQ